MKKWPIALQIYSIRDAIGDDFEGAMRRVKEMGYDGVELAGMFDVPPMEIKKTLDKVGLEWVSAHVHLDKIENDAILSGYAETGMKYIAIPWLDGPKDEDDMKAVIARIRKAGELCKAKGMTLLYHNHDFEFHKFSDTYILDSYYSEIPADLLQTELDTCWVNVGGEDPAAYVRKYTGRAPIVHLKDYTGRKTENMYGLIGVEGSDKGAPTNEFDFRPVGYGRQDMPSIVAAAEDAGAEWLVVEQDRPSMGKTSMECAEMSIRYLKSFL